jgi:hypothetical protein
MASGTLGTPVSLAATTNTTLYTVPASKVATINFNLVNTNATAAKVRVAISSTGTPGAAEWVEYDAYLQPAGDPSNGNVLERSGFVVEAGKNVVVYSDTAGVVARAHGFEQ